MHLNWQQHRRKKSVTYWIGDFFRQSEYSLAVIGKNLSLFQRFLDGKQFNFIPVPILDIVHCFEMLFILPYQDFCTIHLQRQQEQQTYKAIRGVLRLRQTTKHSWWPTEEGGCLSDVHDHWSEDVCTCHQRSTDAVANLYTWTCHWFILTHASFSGSRLTPLSYKHWLLEY